MTAVTDHTSGQEPAEPRGTGASRERSVADSGRADSARRGGSSSSDTDTDTDTDTRSWAASPTRKATHDDSAPPAGEKRARRSRAGRRASAEKGTQGGTGSTTRTGTTKKASNRHHARGENGENSGSEGAEGRAWDDGLIARRAGDAPDSAESRDGNGGHARVEPFDQDGQDAYRGGTPQTTTYEPELRARLDALRELVGLSRTRLDGRTLAEAGRVLDQAAARRGLSDRHTVVAVAGATGSGKSTLFNALAGVAISDTGVRRPTTAAPIACSWTDGAAGLLDRLAIPGRLRRRPLQHTSQGAGLDGLVLVDLPDHDSAAVEHREHVDRILTLVDAVIWVVDPEKYADAVLHERYLRPMAGHAEVSFVVLNQTDRLPGDAADQVLDDLRRLLDDDGIALGEHGEPGATVLSLSALTGDGVSELREILGQFVAERGAAARRISADLDAAAARLRSVYAAGRRVGLSERAREEFSDRLADAVGAAAAGQAAERAWRRNAGKACGTPWLRLWRWYEDRRFPLLRAKPAPAPPADEEATARQRVEQAVRTVGDEAAAGLPAPWAQSVKEAAARGAHGLPEALDELALTAASPARRPPRPGWWPLAVLAQALMTLLQIVGGVWLLGQVIGVFPPNLGSPVLLMIVGIVGGPGVEWACRMAARGPARRYGIEAERKLREAAAACGRAQVLDPVAAELLRYREVREQYVRVTGAVGAGTSVAMGSLGAVGSARQAGSGGSGGSGKRTLTVG
ncbi:GTPase [Streptomyces sp. LHD-70]|uniref:YfjP family GTPase n=1 Tax=Streptomyces sp. LHD-70 TaxID=3072140 RepID=UPI00280F2FA5|nr:GTPase [Streptomyces sp. LHD-70]MDQ8700881.1 GTPase [Streptomyces sp. LHD-70]